MSLLNNLSPHLLNFNFIPQPCLSGEAISKSTLRSLTGIFYYLLSIFKHKLLKPPCQISNTRVITFHLVSLAASTKEKDSSCVCCKGEKHPLYSCTEFRSSPHDEMISLLKKYGHCLTCLRPGHFVKDCKFPHHCKVCQKPYHTLLHVDKPRETLELPPIMPESLSNLTCY